MLEAKLTIDAPELSDAIMTLASAIRDRAGGYTAEATTGRKRRTTKSETPALTSTPTQTADPSETQATATPGTTGTWETGGREAVEQSATATAGDPHEDKPTVDAIAAAGAALCERGKVGELVALLQSYGVQTVTQAYNLDDAAFANFLTGLRALGAQV